MDGAGGRVLVVGVDPRDSRAAAELPEAIPADATALYRLPAVGSARGGTGAGWRNPPGRLLSVIRRLGAGPRERDATADALSSIARDRSIPLRELDVGQPPGAAARSPWWTAGAWIATVLSVGAIVAAVPFLVLLDALPGAILATLSVACAVALLTGMALAHEAASVERGDQAIAAAVATELAEHADERVVLVVPPRHAPGVATALAEAGIEARAIDVQPPPAGVSVARPRE